AIRKFFEKLLQSKDAEVKKNAAVLMLRNNVPVHDSVLISVAEKDQYRASLWRDLEQIGVTKYFPLQYKKQEDIARSLLLEEREVEKFADIQLAGKRKVQVKNYSGYVYFFKYKLKKEDDWKIGISGIQPDSLDSMSVNTLLVSMTE